MTAGPAGWASSPASRRVMQANRPRDTGPEIRLRRAFHRLGLRFFVQRPIVPGTRRRVDVVFPRAKVAVDVRGCFWHACPAHGTAAKGNAGYWADKLAANRGRDADTERRLGDAGWRVIVVWEHDDPDDAAAVIAEEVRARRATAQA